MPETLPQTRSLANLTVPAETLPKPPSVSADPQAALEKIAAVLDFDPQIEGLDRVILDEEDMANNTIQVGEKFGSD